MSVFPILFTTLIVLKFHPKGSVVTSGAISIYGVFLIWTAFVSFPNKQADATCNTVIGSKTSMFAQLFSSLSVALICTFYWSLSSKPSKALEEARVEAIVAEPEEDEEAINQENAKRAAKPEGAKKQERLIDTVEEGSEKDFSAYEDGSYLKFHIFMMFFAIYISPLFTNWGNTSFG